MMLDVDANKVCALCQQEFEEGDNAVSVFSYSTEKVLYLHKMCWQIYVDTGGLTVDFYPAANKLPV